MQEQRKIKQKNEKITKKKKDESSDATYWKKYEKKVTEKYGSVKEAREGENQ